jgi:nucleotide-binding universal stress UspA family protein
MFSLSPIVVPIDFSDRSAGAVRYARELAHRFDARIALVHVIPPPHYEFSALEVGGAVLNEMFANRAVQVKQELEKYMAEELAGLEVERVALEGDPAHHIVKYAQEKKAALILMPTHGYGPFRRFILGSVTAKVLHDADSPVWTGVHLEEAPQTPIRFDRVLAAVDLGAQSMGAVDWAAEFASRTGGRLSVVHVTPALAHVGEAIDPDWRPELLKQARERLEQIVAGRAADLRVETGDIARRVCEVARETGANLLVIGRGSASGVFGRLRTNAYAIIRESPCPAVSV